ncbi:methionyl-tRNA formyltransferase [Scopulibacillus daqui]|uniref:Methionyl-tRNA formyltransferase n=1 Tax=Scopulibacillus daqui TaxID=1469162 RepID=A0ABS2PW58_9BACL|nr:methionyl-tRNA formyltransferase [Scopulibacillus daqui]MBM7644308.1 methionyl-tRNA formyltransferase [Scopulibacillus daqui]
MNVVFMGTPDFSVPVLQQLIDDGYSVKAVVTQPDRPKGRKKQLMATPVKQLALKHQIPVLQPEKIKDAESVRAVLSYEPDLIVTAAYGQILPESLLNEPSFGCINVHASLLPEYRGGAPIHKAIIDGKNKTGVTIMYMVKALDAGDILSQVEVPIGEDDNVGTMHDKLSAAGAALLSQTIPDLIEGKITPVPQNDEKATFAPTITRKDEKIDWHLPGEAVYNLIRGLDPFPGAYTTLDDKVFKIWRSKKVPLKETADAGEIVQVDKDGFTVATGNQTAIKILECQPAGKKRMSCEQFLRGQALSPGIKLGG